MDNTDTPKQHQVDNAQNTQKFSAKFKKLSNAKILVVIIVMSIILISIVMSQTLLRKTNNNNDKTGKNAPKEQVADNLAGDSQKDEVMSKSIWSDETLNEYVLLKPVLHEPVLADPVTGLKTITYRDFQLEPPRDENIQLQYPSNWNAKVSDLDVRLWPGGDGDYYLFKILLRSGYHLASTLDQQITLTKEFLKSRGREIVDDELIVGGNKSSYLYKTIIAEPDLYHVPNSGPLPSKEAFVYLNETPFEIKLTSAEYEKEFDKLVESIEISKSEPIQRMVRIDYKECTTNVEEIKSPYGVTEINILGIKEGRLKQVFCNLEVIYTPIEDNSFVEKINCSVPTSRSINYYHITEESFSYGPYESDCTFERTLNNN